MDWCTNDVREETVYGKRDGTITGMAIISRSNSNFFKQTKAWKTGVIHQVPMLARSDMFKPNQVGSSIAKMCMVGFYTG